MSDPLNAERSEVIRPRGGFLGPLRWTERKIAGPPVLSKRRIGAIDASQPPIAVEVS